LAAEQKAERLRSENLSMFWMRLQCWWNGTKTITE